MASASARRKAAPVGLAARAGEIVCPRERPEIFLGLSGGKGVTSATIDAEMLGRAQREDEARGEGWLVGGGEMGKLIRSTGQDFRDCWASAWPAVGEPFAGSEAR